MKKLYFCLALLSSSFIGIVEFACGMEKSIVRKQEISRKLFPVPSLKTLCLDYIGHNTQHEKINLLTVDNLINLSPDLAMEAIKYVSEDHKNNLITFAQSQLNTWLQEDTNNCIELSQKYRLDHNVLCALVAKTKNVLLAYKLAESGPVTNAVASIIIDHFLSIDIPLCLNDFNSTYNTIFPEEILRYNAYCLYHLLLHKLNYKTYFIIWDKNKNGMFSIEDFNKPMTNNEVARCVRKRNFFNQSFDNACNNGYVALSSCGKFLAFTQQHPTEKTYNTFEIHNIETKNCIKVYNTLPCGMIIDRITFNRDGTHCVVLSTIGEMYHFEVTSMLADNLSLKQLACVIYCYEQLIKKFHIACGTKTGLGYKLLEGSMNETDEILADFVGDNILENTKLSLPIYMHNQLKELVLIFEYAWAINEILEKVSEEIKLSKKEIAIKWFIEQDELFIKNIETIIQPYFDDEKILYAQEAIKYLQNTILLFLT
jgi:hypothetical protein